MAGIINALKVIGKKLRNCRIAVSGTGAAGIACARLLAAAGCRDIIGVDSTGIIYKGRRKNMNIAKKEFAGETNPRLVKGGLAEAVKGADIFIGVSQPDVLTVDMLKTMGKDPIIFALSNPNPEIDPFEAEPHARVVATGRSDYANQVNNVLCFPGFFKGLLDCNASDITIEMKLAAAEAIASVIGTDEISEDYIIPTVFDERVAPEVARAVVDAAIKAGVARRKPKETTF